MYKLLTDRDIFDIRVNYAAKEIEYSLQHTEVTRDTVYYQLLTKSFINIDTIMIDSIYYVFYKLRRELGISLMGKELSSDTIYTAIDRVNIPLLNKDCLQVKRAGEAWEIQGFNISGMYIRVTIDAQGIHISI